MACLLKKEHGSYRLLQAYGVIPGGVGKPSLNRALVAGGRRETRRPIHGQAEGWVIPSEGPNRCTLKCARMSCG